MVAPVSGRTIPIPEVITSWVDGERSWTHQLTSPHTSPHITTHITTHINTHINTHIATNGSTQQAFQDNTLISVCLHLNGRCQFLCSEEAIGLQDYQGNGMGNTSFDDEDAFSFYIMILAIELAKI
jgi:hypothetical protein